MQVAEKIISRKEEILQKAATLFMEKGYSATSVRDIANFIGIEAPSLYSHFKSKEDILQQICFSIAYSFSAGIKTLERINSPIERLENAIEYHIDILIENREAAAVLWNDWKHMSEEKKAEMKELIDNYEETFRLFVMEGVELSVFKVIDVSVSVKVLLSMLNGITTWYKDGMHCDRIKLRKQISDIYIKGILNNK